MRQGIDVSGPSIANMPDFVNVTIFHLQKFRIPEQDRRWNAEKPSATLDP